MAIQSVSEFEAILGRCLIKIDKVLYQRNDPPKLKQARRDLDKVLAASRDADKLKGLKGRLTEAAEVVRVDMSDDEELRNFLWDCEDFIDFGL